MTDLLKSGIDVSQKCEFDLALILSITTQTTLVPMDHIVKVIGYLTGDPEITDIGAMMMKDRAKEIILQQHEQLKNITLPDFGELVGRSARQKFANEWVAEQKTSLGVASLPLSPTNVPLVISVEEQMDWVMARNPNIQITAFDIPEEPNKKPPLPKYPGKNNG